MGVIERGLRRSEAIERRKVLLWNRYGKQVYLVRSRWHTLSEIMDILAYIQMINDEECSSFELSVSDICKILVNYFEFDMKDTNYYEFTKEQRKQLLGKVKRVNYSVLDKNLGDSIFIIELTDFWELYNAQAILKETMGNNKTGEAIRAIVRDNPNVRPWL